MIKTLKSIVFNFWCKIFKLHLLFIVQCHEVKYYNIEITYFTLIEYVILIQFGINFGFIFIFS